MHPFPCSLDIFDITIMRYPLVVRDKFSALC